MTDVDHDRKVCPPLPGGPIGSPHRARIVLDYEENEEPQHAAEDGWACITPNGWVTFLSDADERWQSWPPWTVLCVEWHVSLEPERF